MRDLTIGNLKKHLWKLTLPFFASSVLMMANYVVDSIWLGRLIGQDALAASSVCGVIIYVLVAVIIGVTTGCSILVSQYFGAKKFDEISEVFENSVIVGIVICIVALIVEMTCVVPILKILNVPIELYPMVKLYLRAIFFGLPALFLFYIITSVFRSIGDTKTPLIMAIITVSINFFLDPVLIKYVGWGILGAAICTITTNTIAVIYGFIRLKKNKTLNIHFKGVRINPVIMGKVLKIGVPTMLENGVISLGVALTQFIINRYGVSAVAAYGVGGNVDNLVLNFSFSVGGAVAVITGQNKGKGNKVRMEVGLRYGVKLSIWLTLIFSFICFIFAKQLCEIFISSASAPEVVKIGTHYLQVMAFPYIALVVNIVIISFFNGVGDTKAAMVIAFISIWCFRLPFAFLTAKYFGVNGIWYGIAGSYVLSMGVAILYYYTGRWKKVRVI